MNGAFSGSCETGRILTMLTILRGRVFWSLTPRVAAKVLIFTTTVVSRLLVHMNHCKAARRALEKTKLKFHNPPQFLPRFSDFSWINPEILVSLHLFFQVLKLECLNCQPSLWICVFILPFLSLFTTCIDLFINVK